MKIFLIFIGIFLFVITSIFFYSLYRLHTELNLHSPTDDLTRPDGLSYQTQFVTTADKYHIAYWYSPVDYSKAVVILIHGLSIPGGKTQTLGHAKYLHDAGYTTAVIDLRSFGESSGEKISLGTQEWKDVDAVFTALQALPENKNKKIGLLGISMGATTALVNAGVTHKPDFVIASVPFADLDSLFHVQIQKAGFPPSVISPFMNLAARIELGKNYTRFTPKSLVKDIHVPLLFISAGRDEQVSPHDALELYTMANSPKELWQVDSRHDVFGNHPEEFKQKVLLFLEKYAH